MDAVAPHLRTGTSIGYGRTAWGLVAGLTLALAGCSSPPAAAPKENPKVEVSYPVVQKVTDFEDFTGHTDAVATVEIRARVTGYLDKVFFKEGQEVKEGQPLALIDPRPYDIAVSLAEAAVAQADANLLTFKDVRDRNLNALTGVSEQDRTKSLNDYNGGVAALRTAKESLRNAKLNLEWTTIKAPVSGKVGKRLIDPGNTVQANTTGITTIRSQNPIFGYFDVDEGTVLRLRRSQGTLGFAAAVGLGANRVAALTRKQTLVQYALADDSGFSPERVGTLDFEDNQIDLSTGTQRFRCVIDNERRLLMPGMFVRVRFILGAPYDAVLISERAVGTDQGQKYVFVVDDDNKVHYRNIKVGPLNNGLRVVADDTLRRTERIVVVGLQRVRDGVTIEPKEIAMPKGAAPTKTPLTTAASGGDKKGSGK